MQKNSLAEASNSVDPVLVPISQAEMLPRQVEAWRQRLVKLTLIFSDVVLAFFIWELACVIEMVRVPGYLSGAVVLSIVPVTLMWVGLRAMYGLYPGYGMDEVEELRRQTYALLATLAFTAIFALAFHVGDSISRFLVGLVFLSLLLLSPFMRWFVKKWMMKHGVWGKPVVIVGSREIATSIEKLLSKEWALGYKPVAVFHEWLGERPALVRGGDEGMPREGVLTEVVGLGRKHRVDTFFLAMPRITQEYLAVMADLASNHFRNVIIVPDLAGVTNSAVVARNFAGTLGIEMRHNLLNPAVRRMKRALDLTAVIFGGALILPLFLLLSGLVWLESRGAIFYTAERLGRNGRPFSCVKFQTMVPDAEALLQRVLEEDPAAREEYAKYHKLRDDPRVTRIGRFLRKTSLDELPQLWNVLRGEMSLVGPRPYLQRESEDIGTPQGYILRVYPGMTGPWQVDGRNSASFEERVQMDAYYVRNWSIWLDIVLLARTLRSVLTSRGAY